MTGKFFSKQRYTVFDIFILDKNVFLFIEEQLIEIKDSDQVLIKLSKNVLQSNKKSQANLAWDFLFGINICLMIIFKNIRSFFIPSFPRQQYDCCE